MNKRVSYSKRRLHTCILLIAFSVFSQNLLGQCIMSMGYRLEDKSPFMAASPDNRGFYFDLYSQAAKAIDCQLQVVRRTKKRILADLSTGKVDFYPAYNYSEKRLNAVYFISTGIMKKNVGISRETLADISQLSQLKDRVVILPLGSINHYQDIESIQIYEIPNMGFEKAISLLKRERGDFYYANYSEFLYYLKQRPLNTVTGNDWAPKVHHDCCGGEKRVYLAFSRRSPHFKDKANPDFKSEQPISIANLPRILDPSSKAYQFESALIRLEAEGKTQKIYDQYFR